MLHKFNEDLEYSHQVANADWWEVVYRKAFPDFLTMGDIQQNGWCQQSGVDRIIVLKSGKIIRVDEKVRREDYGDILLEFLSSEERKTPGWIEKPLNCDFIAYAVEPTKKCYLLPFETLRRAWARNRIKWLQGRIIRAKNEGYTTCSVAVPVKTLLIELVCSTVFDFSEEETI
jgi:hypothetical protein